MPGHRTRRHPRPTAPHPPAARPTPAPLAPPPPLPSVAADDPPAYLVPLYRAAGARYGIRWSVLAAINAIETDFGATMAVSPAGAIGWMQFLPTTWAAYGVDADRDGVRDPEDPVDAIFAAARYLAAAGAARDLRGALFAYNHADWYVADVLARAQAITDRSGPLSAMLAAVAGGRFPVAGPVRWRTEPGADRRRAVALYGRRGAPVQAIADARIVALGRSRRSGRYVVLRDALGTRFTYIGLGAWPAQRPTWRAPAKVRLFAHPQRSGRRSAVGFEQLLAAGVTLRGYASYDAGGRRQRSTTPSRLRLGAHVRRGTILGWVGRIDAGAAAHIRLAVRPRGAHARRIDPRLLLDGWRHLERSPTWTPAILTPATSLLAGAVTAPAVLADPRITIYPCGRADLAAGLVDPRVLGVLEHLADAGLRPTVSSLRCGHSLHTTRGTISEHASGNAVDIAAINGVPILDHQGPGSIAELAIRCLLELQGPMRPHQIISLMTFPEAGNTLALPDHDDHIHVGFRPPSA